MNAEDIITIIDAIPQYIKYFYPGYITIYVYYFLRAKHVPDTKTVVFKAFFISYIYSIMVNKLNLQSELQINFWFILLAVLVAYSSYLISKSEFVLDVFQTLGIETSFCDNEIEALQSIETGTWLVVYLNNDNIVYEGWLHYKELEEGKRQYISLRGFRKYLLSDNGKPLEPYIEEHDMELEEEVVLFYENIKRIEKRYTS